MEYSPKTIWQNELPPEVVCEWIKELQKKHPKHAHHFEVWCLTMKSPAKWRIGGRIVLMCIEGKHKIKFDTIALFAKSEDASNIFSKLAIANDDSEVFVDEMPFSIHKDFVISDFRNF